MLLRVFMTYSPPWVTHFQFSRKMFTLRSKHVKRKLRRNEWSRPRVCEPHGDSQPGERRIDVRTLFTVSPIQRIPFRRFFLSCFRHDWIIYDLAWESGKQEREVPIVYILCGSTRSLLMALCLLRWMFLHFSDFTPCARRVCHRQTCSDRNESCETVASRFFLDFFGSHKRYQTR